MVGGPEKYPRDNSVRLGTRYHAPSIVSTSIRTRAPITQLPISTINEQSIHAALELSKDSWLLAIRAPGRDNPSLHSIKGSDAEGLRH